MTNVTYLENYAELNANVSNPDLVVLPPGVNNDINVFPGANFNQDDIRDNDLLVSDQFKNRGQLSSSTNTSSSY